MGDICSLNGTMRIDLHGLTLNEAHSLVAETIEECYYNEEKIVQFITGRSGEMHREFPMWIENNQMIRDYKRNGDGAFIVFMRKK